MRYKYNNKGYGRRKVISKGKSEGRYGIEKRRFE